MTEFSLPQPKKPVPSATVKVYFFLQENGIQKFRFRFENDQLYHNPEQTIVSNKMEV